jgi:hypothetical protein
VNLVVAAERATKGVEIMKRRKIYYRDWHKKAKPENIHDLRRRIEELDRILQQLAVIRKPTKTGKAQQPRSGEALLDPCMQGPIRSWPSLVHFAD